jgi:orotidine-5'-phosphate decarboxylase
MVSKVNSKPVIVALDFPSGEEALACAGQLDPSACRVKVGNELFTREGPDIVARLMKRDFEVFLDLKFHDIPNTVAQACRAAAAMGVWMLNIHVMGGKAMLEAAKAALEAEKTAPLLIGVTLLTSLSEADLDALGWPVAPEAAVLRLAKMAKRAHLDGIVCSAQEAPALREALGSDFLLITPGIRPRSSAEDDQKRIAAPTVAINNGADYLVIGRPITRTADPASALAAILREIKTAQCD